MNRGPTRRPAKRLAPVGFDTAHRTAHEPYPAGDAIAAQAAAEVVLNPSEQAIEVDLVE